jgi:superfamily II DNA or RNA helicase
MEKLPGGASPGAVVRARDERWRVAHVQPFDDGEMVTLDGDGERNRGRRTTLITPFDRLLLPAPHRERRRHRRTVLRTAAAAVARERPGRAVWAAVDGVFDVHAWQLAPVLAVAGGATRVLLADAVGLGKTVQAGLILADLWHRGLLARALVLTPASLRTAWATELRDRFGLDVMVVDQPALLDQQRSGPVYLNPWASVPIVISSIDLVKRPEVRAAVEDEPLDMLVVDEAHHATRGSDRGAVVARLAARVPWLVLASATPHAGDTSAYRALLGLGQVSTSEPPMIVFRRSHRDAALATSRATHVLRVTPTAAERRLQDAIVEYGRALLGGPLGSQGGVHLVAGVLARRATSSPWAAACTLRRRLHALSSVAPAIDAQPALPWEELDDGDAVDELEARWLSAPSLISDGNEADRLRAAIALAEEAASTQSKFRRLVRLLLRVREPVIVFSEFRDTLDACLPYVQATATVVMLHGGLDALERGRLLRQFLDGPATVLLATDVAGEGLNLQRRARVVITLEWPWSPQRLEQRIGRVDRLGQSRRVHAFHLTAAGTFEETVVARLLERSARARRDLDDVPGHTELEVATQVFAAAPAPADDEPPRDRPSATGRCIIVDGWTRLAADEAARVTARRRLAAHGDATEGVTVWCHPRRRRSVRSLAVIVEVASRTIAGRRNWSHVVALRVELQRRCDDKRTWARMCRSIARDPRISDAAITTSRAMASCANWSPVIARRDAIARTRAGAPQPGVQASLFDRRAVRAAEAREAVLAKLAAHAARQSQWLLGPSDEERLEAHVVALLPCEDARTP